MLTSADVSACIFCRKQFNDRNRQPCTQSCQHSICFECLDGEDRSEGCQVKCPIDYRTVNLSHSVNQPLLKYLQAASNGREPFLQHDDASSSATSKPPPNDEEKAIEYHLTDLALMLSKGSGGPHAAASASAISPQLGRKLLHLIESTFQHREGKCEFVRRISLVFNRLLLELIQAHYNTGQRERDLRRLITSKGLTIEDPALTDQVIELLMQIYEAANTRARADASFERKVLISFLVTRLPKNEKKQVERVLQTLYRSSCFHIMKGGNEEKSKYKLKENLWSVVDLRRQHDVELIKLAQAHHIRLPADRWAYLLHRRADGTHQDAIAHIQSLLDQYQSPVTLSELKLTIGKVGDKYNIEPIICDLGATQDLINGLMAHNEPDAIEAKQVCELIARLAQLKGLFTIRQCRKQFSS